MPVPGKGEKQDDFHGRCVAQMVKEGKPQDQANAICYSIWRERGNKKESVREQLPQPRTSPTPAVIEPGQPREKQYEFMARCVPAVKDKYAGLDDEGAMAICFTLWGTRYEDLHPVDAQFAEGGQYEGYESYHQPHLQESAGAVSHLVEAMDFTGAEFVEEAGVRVVKNVVMLGAVSKHGYEYRQEAMAKAVSGKLYEGCRIFINHAAPGQRRDLMDLAGCFQNVRHEGGKVKGDAHLLQNDPGRQFWEIAKTMPHVAGCSHVADGRLVTDSAGKKWVEEIKEVQSVDLVVQGATTLNVFEGDEPQGDKIMDLKEARIEDLRTTRKDLVHELVQEGAKTRDEEVQALILEKQGLTKQVETLGASEKSLKESVNALTEEKKQLQKKLDDLNVLEATRQKEAAVDKAFKEAKLPEQAVTKTFRDICLSASGGTPFDLKVFEASVAELVKDRKTLCEQNGVRNMGTGQQRDESVKTAAQIAEESLTEGK